jgi:hypothetical protein
VHIQSISLVVLFPVASGYGLASIDGTGTETGLEKKKAE